MAFIISFLFIVEFLLVILIFFYLLLNKGFTFKGGIAFGLMYFIFIPILVLIFTGKIPIGKTSFGGTTLTDVILTADIKSSLILLAYIFAIIIFLYFNFSKEKSKPVKNNFKLNISFYTIIYVVSLAIIFIGSGLLKGGNWYDNRDDFFKDYGSVAIIISFVLNASKILIITSIFYLKYKKAITLKWLFIYAITFTIFDMLLSGNRIYFFITIVLLGLFFLKKYPIKAIIIFPFAVPFLAIVAYFGSIFRHIRGPLFRFGFPTAKVFIESFQRAIKLEPFNLSTFFLNISESVNVNVIYNLFNRYDHILYGATYLKTLFFYIPRSIWEGKPESITVLAAKKFGTVSLVTTIIGEMQMNFKHLGILLIPLLLWITESIIRRLSNNNNFYRILAFFFGILIFRMPYSDEIIVLLFVILIISVSNKKWIFRIKSKNG